jgi:hypothetical protein
MRRIVIGLLAVLWSGIALAQPPYGPGAPPGGGPVAATIDCRFIGIPNGSSPSGSLQTNPLCAPITVNRASIETTGLYTDAPGSTYTTCASNVPCFEPSGLMVFQNATNYLLNSDSPATQTTTSLAAGTYALWVIGTGSATPSAGTITGCTGFAATAAGTPTVFTCTGSGTVTVTVSGSLTRFQLENSSFATSYIPTTSAPVTRLWDEVWMSITGAQPMSMATAYVPMGSGTNDTQTPLQLDIGNNNSRFDLDLGIGQTHVGCGLTVNTVAQPTLAAPQGNITWTTGLLGKMALTVSPDGTSACAYNGQTPGTGTGVLTFTPTRIQLGAGGNAIHQCNCIVEWIDVWWRALSLTEIQNVTK